MKKIAWLTSNNFIDVDLPILSSINSNYIISWNIIVLKNRIENYDLTSLKMNLKSKFLDIHISKIKYRKRSFFTFFNLSIFLYKIKKSSPDIVYVNCELEPFLPFLLRFFFKPENVIIAIHDVKPHNGIPKIFHIFLFFKIKLFSNFHLFSNTQNNIFESRYKNKNIFLIPLFLNNFGNSIVKPNENLVQFLFFGTIREYKGLDILIHAVNKLAVCYKGLFKLKISGHCDNWSFYQKLILDNDVFDFLIEKVPNEKIADLFCQSHYIVLPYKDVTQSGPLMLSFNYAIPAIASNLPGFQEYIQDKDNGFLFESENIDELFDIMSQIIEKNHIIYKNMKENLENYVKFNFELKEVIKMYDNMFHLIK